MDHDFRVRQREALAFLASAEEHCAHGSRHADAHRRDIRLDVVHRVDDGQSCGDVSAGGVDVEGDVFLGVFGGEEEELGDYKIGDVVVDAAAEEDDAFLEEARVDVIGALAHVRLLDDHRDKHLSGDRCVFHMEAMVSHRVFGCHIAF